MNSNYSFLERNQKSEAEKQRSNIDAMWDQLGSMGLVGKNRSFFTGYGEDGVLQSNRPTGILNTSQGPKTVHEGEPVNVAPDGSFSVIPADKTMANNGQGTVQDYMPASQVGGQSNLENIEEKNNIQGYQEGTPDEYINVAGIPNGTPRADVTNADNSVSGKPAGDMYKDFQTRGLQRLERYASGTDPTYTSIMNAERERFAGEAATSRGSLSQEQAQSNIKGREAATEQAMLGRQIGQQESDLIKSLREKQYDTAFTAAQQLPSATATAMAGEREQESLDFTKEQWKDTEGQRMLSDALVMDSNTWLQRHPGSTIADYTKARDEATLNQRQVSLAETQWAGAEGSRMLSDALVMGADSWMSAHPGKTLEDYNAARDEATLNQRQVALTEEKWAGEEGQRMLSDALVMSEDTWLERHPGSTAADYATARDQATLQQQAQQLSKARFDQETTQYEDSNVWKGYEAAVIAGDFDVAAEKYKEVTGSDIDTTTMEKYQDYLDQKRSQEILSGDIAIDAQTLGVSSDRLEAFIDAVNSGADRDTANAASGLTLNKYQFDKIARDYSAEGEVLRQQVAQIKNQVGQEIFDSMMDRINSGASLNMVNNEFDTTLTAQDFMNMYNTTATGQTEWQRKLTAASMLMETQDPGNIKEAASIYNDIFPGVSMDVGQLIQDVSAERWAQGVSDLSTLAATFDTWDEALSSAVGLKVLDNMDLTNREGRELFQSLKINQIDESWSAIEDSDWYKKLEKTDPDSAELVQNTFAAGLTGELEFDIKPVYNVLDKNGNLIESFDNIKDAEAKKAEDKTYTVDESKNYIYKNLTSGDTVVVNNNTGEVIDENGEGKTVPTNDAWTLFQDSQADLPESKQIGYNDWKIAWDKAGNVNNFTYDDYKKNVTEDKSSISQTLSDKYKDGWPTITLQPFTENVADRENKIMRESDKDLVMGARKNFIANPENITELTTNNTQDIFKSINDDLLEKTKEGLIAYRGGKTKNVSTELMLKDGTESTIAKDYLQNKFFYIEGYDAPFIIKNINGVSDQALGYPTQITSVRLVNLADGSTLTWDSTGEVKNAAWQ